jgi:N-acetylglucosaminyldiphosphoundecaprenol N-acetyl-beta-D-mannosaminyltransferase
MVDQVTIPRKIDFLGVHFHDVNMTESLALIDSFVKSRLPHKMFSVNVACYVESLEDSFMKSFYESCELLTVDGMGIFYAGRILGIHFRETVPTSYFTLELLKVAAFRKYRIYLLGSKAEYLRRAVSVINKRYPGVNVVGASHGYFSAEEEDSVVERIAHSMPDILLIGISTPIKERFVQRNFDRLNTPVQIGVGGTIDVLAGVIHLPPAWIRKAGLEWIYRLSQEPRRFWKRYLRTNLIFGGIMAKELSRRRDRTVL